MFDIDFDDVRDALDMPCTPDVESRSVLWWITSRTCTNRAQRSTDDSISDCLVSCWSSAFLN